MSDPTNFDKVPDLEMAMRFWAGEMTKALNQKFGKDKVGHILIVFPFGRNPKASWISNARAGSVIEMLRSLADHIEAPDAKIIRPH